MPLHGEGEGPVVRNESPEFQRHHRSLTSPIAEEAMGPPPLPFHGYQIHTTFSTV